MPPVDPNVESAIVLAAAAGISARDLAQFHSFTPAGMRSLLERLKPQIDAKRRELTHRVAMAQITLLEATEQAARNIANSINNPQDKHSNANSIFLLERVLPKPEERVSVEHGFTPELQNELVEGMRALRAMNTIHELAPVGQDPHIVEGATAAARIREEMQTGAPATGTESPGAGDPTVQ